MPSILTRLPDPAMDTILKKLPFQSIMTLRKVCRPLRQYIDRTKPDAAFGSIFIRLGFGEITLSLSRSLLDSKPIEYRQTEHGCLIQYGQKRILLMGKSIAEIFHSDLSFVLSFQQKELAFLWIYGRHAHCLEENDNLLDKLGEILQERPRNSLLKVGNLQFESVKANQIMKILLHVNPGNLTGFSLLDPLNKKHIVPFNEIVQLSQWKLCKTITICDIIIDGEVQDFLHCNDATVSFRSISLKDLKSIIQSFFNSTIMRRLVVRFKEFKDEERVTQLESPLQELVQITNKKKFHFLIPPNTKALCICRRRTKNVSVFEFSTVFQKFIPRNSQVFNGTELLSKFLCLEQE